MTLQFSRCAEGWRTVMGITPESRGTVLGAAERLASILGPRTRWAILHADGRRELLTFGAADDHCR